MSATLTPPMSVENMPASFTEDLSRMLTEDSLETYIKESWHIVEPANSFINNWHISLITEYLELVNSGEIKRLIINIPPKYLKPVHIESEVLMGDGSRKLLKEIKVGDFVIGSSGFPRKVLALSKTQNLLSVKITTFCGREVIAALEHPFLTPEGWVEAGKLKIDQRLALISNSNVIMGKERIDEEFELAGYFIGDGSTASNKKGSCQATICSNEPEYQEDVLRCSSKLDFKALTRKGKNGLLTMEFSNGVRNWIREIGLFGKTSKTKRVPEFVFKGELKQISKFLAAYFHCDGTVYKRKEKGKRIIISFSSISKGLLQDTQHLLLRFGISSRLRKKVANTTGKWTPAGYISYNLDITNEDEACKFINRIPIKSYKKQRLINFKANRKLFDAPFLPDRIISIEHIGEIPCKCLEVQEDSSFTISDIVVHNSRIVSVLWPTWSWAKEPASKWIFCSHAQDLCVRDSRYRRQILQSDWYRKLWGNKVKFASDQNAKTEYENTATGSMICKSVGASAVGRGANFIVIDDPIDPKRAYSDKIRDDANQWIDHTISTRLDDKAKGGIVLIMQRLHDKDSTGHLLDKKSIGGGQRWTHLVLPAEAERKTTIIFPKTKMEKIREEGDPLCPIREDSEILAQQKIDMGSFGYAGQFQQRPSPAGGGIIKKDWWRFYNPESLQNVTMDIMIQSWDMSFKDLHTSSYVVGQVWGRLGSRRYLLDQYRFQGDFVKTIRMVRTMTQKWPEATAKLIEDKANGSAIISALAGEIPGLIPVNPHASKAERLVAVSPYIEAGNVFLPTKELNPWVDTFILEYTQFPNGANDDQVDCGTQALKYLSTNNNLGSSDDLVLGPPRITAQTGDGFSTLNPY